MEGLETILEQINQGRLKEYLKNLNSSEKTQQVIDNGNLLAADVAMCKVCGDISDDEYYTLTDEDGVEDLTINFEDLYFDDLKKFEPYLENIILNARKKIDKVKVGIVFEIDTSVDPYDKLDDAEKDKFLKLTSVEEDLLAEICYILETLLVYSLDTKASEPTKALKYYKAICKEFKPKKIVDKESEGGGSDIDEPDKVIGCMDEKAKNYNEKYDTDCGTCCTYDVNLAPISYNISFYKTGQFPDGNKFTMYMDNTTYGVCVQERIYSSLGEDKLFNGYQDNNDIPLNKIDKDRFVFKDDVGFYSDSPSEELKSDLRRAITLYMNRATRSYKGDTEEKYGCVPAPVYMNGIIVEIKDSSGVNHGVIRFGGENPTLSVDEPGFAKWLDYRASNTPNGRENTSNDVKFVNVDEAGSFYRMSCKRYNNLKSWTSKSVLGCDGSDGVWLTLSNTVSESTIGLGTLLRRKEKPNIGLGSLLED